VQRQYLPVDRNEPYAKLVDMLSIGRGGHVMRHLAMFIAVALAFPRQAEAACRASSSGLLRISGNVNQGGLQGSFNRTVALASGRFAETVDLGAIKTGTGFDGRLAWSRDVSGASHHLTSEFARRLAVSEAWLVTHLSCPAPNGSPMSTHLGVDANTRLDVWRVTPPDGAPLDLSYDTHTGRLDRAALRYSENRLIHHYADWRQVSSGSELPFAQRDEDPDDESETVYTVLKVVPVRNASFGPPRRPNDSRILSGDSTTVRFEDDGGHRVYLSVYLNGKGPFAFELDNGGHFILTAATAKQLGLSLQGSFASTGAGNGISQAGYAKIKAVRVGSAELLNQTVKVLPLSHNDRPGLPPRAGILGLELFERFVVGVDHINKTVSLRLAASAPYPGRSVPLVFDEDAPLVAGAIDGVKGNVMLDIGNAGSTIVEDYWAKQHGLTEKLLKGNEIDSEWLSTGAVSLGPITLENQKLTYFGPSERGSESTRSVAAIAGEPLLSRFNAVYDYKHRQVWLEQLPERPPTSGEKRP
jgi:hypothetical protein